jgi:hypothetical protein
MKFHNQLLPSFFKHSRVKVCLLCLFSINSFAADVAKVKTERWFEIEVILVNQLNDKNNLKEQFSGNINKDNLPRYSQSFDLISKYLQPDLTNIKQFIPLCSDSESRSLYQSMQPKLMVNLPDQMAFIEQSSLFRYEPIELALVEENEDTLSKEDITEESIIPLASIMFTMDLKTEVLDNPLFSIDSLCIYSQSDFDTILNEEQLANFNIDSFPIEALPKRLNAPGTHVESSPYLISNDSLLLSDINTRLRWSKEFKPLLHFGWRQVGITRNKAIPLKVFAGHHYDNDYEMAKKDYQEALQEALEQEKILFEKLQESSDQAITSSLSDESSNGNNNTLPQDIIDEEKAKQKYYARLKQESFSTILNDINNIDSDDNTNQAINRTVEQLAQQTLIDLLPSEDDSTIQQPLNIANPPTKPNQPWFLDGFIKVHLDHYLYINADFNIATKAKESDISSADKTAMQLINFSQNRRVITGEIHYFDHPFVGMIVQIRRFDPTKPADEAVSQAIK